MIAKRLIALLCLGLALNTTTFASSRFTLTLNADHNEDQVVIDDLKAQPHALMCTIENRDSDPRAHVSTVMYGQKNNQDQAFEAELLVAPNDQSYIFEPAVLPAKRCEGTTDCYMFYAQLTEGDHAKMTCIYMNVNPSL